MPFPLPLNPQFRKEVVVSWLDDAEDQMELRNIDKANESWGIANNIYLSLPPGFGEEKLEERLVAVRVRIRKHHT